MTNGLTAVPPGSNGLSGACFTHRGEISRVNGHSLSFIDDPKALSSEKDIKQEDSIGNGPDRQDSNFMDAFDDFDTDSYRTYQTSLDTIISRMSEAVVSGELETNQQPCKSQEQPNGSLTLSISNTVSVEPLHFLGIAPTAENAALLSACKFSLPYLLYCSPLITAHTHSR